MFTKATIEQYFLSFKHEHLFLLMLAVVSIIVAVLFFFALKKHFFKGFAIPLFSAAMLLFTVAFSNFNNADRLRKICVYDYDLHPEYLKTRELVRLDSFLLNANIIFYTSLFFAFAAIIMFFYFRKKLNAQYIKGIAASICLMAIITAITFFTIKKEAKIYKDGIVTFTKEISLK